MHSYYLSHSAPVTREFIKMYSNIWLAGSIDVRTHEYKNVGGQRELLKPCIRRYNLVIKGTEWSEFENYIKSLRTEEVFDYKDLTNDFFKTTNRKIINYSGV
jgi:hypothetical protein